MLKSRFNQISIIAKIALVAFILNFLWENVHIFLYVSHLPIKPTLALSTIATLGDVGLTLFAYWFITTLPIPQRGQLLSLALCGLVIAIATEKIALHYGWWEYRPTMPIIPGLQVGLSPILQLTILIPLTYSLEIQRFARS